MGRPLDDGDILMAAAISIAVLLIVPAVVMLLLDDVCRWVQQIDRSRRDRVRGFEVARPPRER